MPAASVPVGIAPVVVVLAAEVPVAAVAAPAVVVVNEAVATVAVPVLLLLRQLQPLWLKAKLISPFTL